MIPNPYTQAVKKIHAPSRAVDRAIALSRRSVSSDSRHRPWTKAAAIAAAAAIVLGMVLIYGIFVRHTSIITLDSRESVTVTLNSRMNVLSAGGHPDLTGESAERAVSSVVSGMLSSGALDEDANTLIIGGKGLGAQTLERVSDSALSAMKENGFSGAIICLACSDSGAVADLIDLLSEAVDTFTPESLRGLSPNELNILLREYLTGDGMALIGLPSQSGYIGEKSAESRALLSSGHDAGATEVAFSVYHGRLVYLVRITDEAYAAAYYINAADGTIEAAVATTAPEQLDEAIRSLEAGLPDRTDEITDVSRSPSAVSRDSAETPTVRYRTESPSATQPTESETVSAVPTAPVGSAATAVTPTQPPTRSQLRDDGTKSLSADIPYDSILSESNIPKGGYVNDVIFTSLDSFMRRLNWDGSSHSKSDVTLLGRQDSHITLYRCYDDLAADIEKIESDSELYEYYARLMTENGMDEDFFNENAALIVTYHTSSVYRNEQDSIDAVVFSDGTAYVTMMRKSDTADDIKTTDHLMFVTAAKVKKADIEGTESLKLAVIEK